MSKISYAPGEAEKERTEGKNDILILGLGNLLMGDEGAGIHLIRKLDEAPPEGADLLDGGTGGYHLLGHLQSYSHVILVDASLDDHPPGTVRVLHPRFAPDFPVQLSAHEIGVRDLVEAVYIAGEPPAFHLVTITAGEYSKVSLDLSPEVEAALPVAVLKVRELVKTLS